VGGSCLSQHVRSDAVLSGSLPWMRRDLTSRSLPYGGVLLILRSAGPEPDIAVAALAVAVVGVRNSHLEERRIYNIAIK
jgi:hypothetical protein